MIIFCCGMSRSGSTVQYQITKRLAEEHLGGRGLGMINQKKRIIIGERYRSETIVVKSEQYQPWARDYFDAGVAVGIGIYRDFRDVVVSLMNFYSSRKDYKAHTDADGSFDDTLMNYAVPAMNWQSCWERRQNVFFLKYEDWWPNLERMTHPIAQILEISSDVEDIEKEFTIARNRSRIAEIRQWIDLKDSLLTKNHIGLNDGRPGQYKLNLEKAQIAEVENIGGEWLKKHGYT